MRNISYYLLYFIVTFISVFIFGLLFDLSLDDMLSISIMYISIEIIFDVFNDQIDKPTSS